MKSVVVVIPTYNEAENIQRMLDALRVVFTPLGEYQLDILVVDDSSPDGTAGIVRRNMKTSEHIHLLKGQKAGLGTAYLRGFEHVLKNFDPYAVIMMDADMSHDPAAIPSMLAAIENGAEYVIGSRYVQGGTIPGNWPLKRILNSRVANSLAKLLIDVPSETRDITGGYKAISGTALRRIDLSQIQAAGYVFQVSLYYAFQTSGAVIREVPIKFLDREFGSSKMRLSDITEFIYRCYQLNPDSKVRRIVRFGLVGAIGAVVNLLTLFILVHGLRVPVLTAAIMAIELSIVSNFLFHEQFTFKPSADELTWGEQSRGLFSRLSRFNTGALIGAGVSFAVLALLYSELRLFYLAADTVAIITATTWNYWMSTKFVWRQEHDA